MRRSDEDAGASKRQVKMIEIRHRPLAHVRDNLSRPKHGKPSVIHDLEVYNAQTLQQFPRLLSLALMDAAMIGPSLNGLLEDVASIDRRLHNDVQQLVEDSRFPRRVHQKREGSSRRSTVSLAGTIAKLDSYALADDYRRVREVADGILLLLSAPSDRAVCARLAASAHKDLARVSASSAVRALAAASGLPPVRPSDLQDLVAEVDEQEELAESQSVDTFVTQADLDLGKGQGYPIEVVNARRLMRDWMLVARQLIGDANQLVVGLHGMAAGYHSPSGFGDFIPDLARRSGEELTKPLRSMAALQSDRDGRRRVREARRKWVAEAARQELTASVDVQSATCPPVAQGDRVVVCPSLPKNGSSKGKEIARGYERVMGCGLPLVLVPDLATARASLLEEFPHCEGAVDRVLRDLIGKRHVEWTPLLFRGAPGVGKSRFVRRLGETLGVGVFRVDGSNDGSSSFAGTERRWYSTEPNRPFMACARFEQANPLVLVDEIDKAPVRTDYGRLWDALLQFMERETASRFQDPSMQVEMNLSHVSIVATANTIDAMPGPLLDRFAAIVDLPAPTNAHLPALAVHLGREIAKVRGWDQRFVEPFNFSELALMRQTWGGGSIRRLGRIVETVMRGRERIGRANSH